jgi:hypothetical protein
MSILDVAHLSHSYGGREILSKGAMSTTPHTSEVKIMLSTIIPLKDLIAN